MRATTHRYSRPPHRLRQAHLRLLRHRRRHRRHRFRRPPHRCPTRYAAATTIATPTKIVTHCAQEVTMSSARIARTTASRISTMMHAAARMTTHRHRHRSHRSRPSRRPNRFATTRRLLMRLTEPDAYPARRRTTVRDREECVTCRCIASVIKSCAATLATRIARPCLSNGHLRRRRPPRSLPHRRHHRAPRPPPRPPPRHRPWKSWSSTAPRRGG